MGKQLEVILTEDIKGLGKKWEVKKVNWGFYYNYLKDELKDKVWLNNEQNSKEMEKRKQQEHAAALLREEKAKELYEKINNLQLNFTLKKDHKDGNDKVFGSVRAEDILGSLKQQGFSLEKKQLLDFVPLTSLGDNLLKIKLSKDLTAQVKVTITAQ
jgi:large subunit ribosomal protein L9